MKNQCDEHGCTELLCGCPVKVLEQACEKSCGQCDENNCETIQEYQDTLEELKIENVKLRVANKRLSNELQQTKN